MAIFTCEKCGATVDCRCKPKKCQNCGESGCVVKDLTAGQRKEIN